MYVYETKSVYLAPSTYAVLKRRSLIRIAKLIRTSQAAWHNRLCHAHAALASTTNRQIFTDRCDARRQCCLGIVSGGSRRCRWCWCLWHGGNIVCEWRWRYDIELHGACTAATTNVGAVAAAIVFGLCRWRRCVIVARLSRPIAADRFKVLQRVEHDIALHTINVFVQITRRRRFAA